MAQVFPLSPFEVQTRVTIKDMAIGVEKPDLGRTLTLANASLSAKISSSGEKSLSVRAASDIDLDGASLAPLRLDVNVQNLFPPKGKLSLSDISVGVEGSLPGMTIDLKCDLRRPVIRDEVEIDLPKLMKMVGPSCPLLFRTWISWESWNSS